MTTGEALKKELGLSKFTFVTIQKILGLAIPTFIITVDSRHPSTYIPYSRLIKLKFATLKKVISSKPKSTLSDPRIITAKFTMTPPMELENYDRIIPTRSLILFRDLAGFWYRNAKMYENTEKGLKEIV